MGKRKGRDDMAAKSANLYARIEPDVKEQAEEILATLGIPASNAINMFYKQIILNRGLPFEVKIPTARPVDISRMNAETLDMELEKGYADMQAGRTKSAAQVFADIRRGYNDMKYDVTFTEQAENDLRGIFEYIAFDLLSPENAAGQLDRIEEKILSLGEYPEKFRQYEREPWKSRNTRVVPVDNYAIFYIPDKTKKLVTVIRVMYSGRDVDKQLDEFTKL